MSLAGIIGHQQALRVLRRAFAEERVPPAYLFVGPPDLGKYTVALQFAKLLNCTQVRAREDPDAADCCDECPSCRRIEEGHFADVLAARPVVRIGKGAQTESTEFEGAVLTTDQIGEVITRAGLKASRGRHKVLIVARAETMNPEAANRLLKTLEEPPPRTTIILTSSNPSAMLPTTVSRCQKVSFHPVPLEELLEGLAARAPGADRETLETVARLGAGRVGWALSVLQTPEALAVRREALELLTKLPGQPLVASLALAEELVRLAERWWLARNEGTEAAEDVLKRSADRVRRVALCELLDLMASALRDVMLLASGDGKLVLNVDRLSELRGMAEGTTPQMAHRAALAVEHVQRHLRGNANLRLACELLLLQIMQACRQGTQG